MDNNSKILRLVFLLLLVIANLLIWKGVTDFNNKPTLKVVFLDVGQGDSILIETRSGNQVLIDAGPNDSLIRVLSKEIGFFDKEIDILLATHPDADHIGGFPALLGRFDVGLYIESGNKSETLLYQSLEDSLLKKGTERVFARRGMIIDLGEGVFIEILFPDRDVSSLEPNTASVIARVVYGDTSFLLTGDSPKSIENYLVSIYGKGLESEVLKLGHHGSKTSTSDLFLNLTSPQFAVVSAGGGNRYGHPHKEVMSRVDTSGAKVLSTSGDGTITFFSDGEKVWLK